MDDGQANHLKAYGVAYWALEREVEVEWLLNYRGGSFLIEHYSDIEKELIIRGVSFEVIGSSAATGILMEISNPQINQDAIKLEKAPKIAVYSPKSAQPWDDAVTLVLTYAEIPYEVIYTCTIGCISITRTSQANTESSMARTEITSGTRTNNKNLKPRRSDLDLQKFQN